jgi:hypothetical protein
MALGQPDTDIRPLGTCRTSRVRSPGTPGLFPYRPLPDPPKKQSSAAQVRREILCFSHLDVVTCPTRQRYPPRAAPKAMGQSSDGIHSHKMQPAKLISEIATWLRIKALNQNIPGGAVIPGEFLRMQKELRTLCKMEDLLIDELSYYDFCKLARTWISNRDA